MLKTAKCTRCGGTHPTIDMIKTTSPKRGERSAYICRRCATHNEGYHTSNNVKQGTTKVNAVCVGVEFETSFSNMYARNIMFEYGFIPTHDGSLLSDGDGNRYGGWDRNACEYVSGIMQGLNKLSKFCVTAEKLMKDEHMMLNETCGTHLHVSVNNMKDANGEYTYMDMIRRFHNSLFAPLSEAMANNTEGTIKLFGRCFDMGYTQPINEHTSVGRYNFINVTANNNIEFRICKFNNAKQYQEASRFCVKAVQTIIANFCEHFNEQPKDARRYPTLTAYRKHKADVTAKKLIKMFNDSIAKLEA